MADDPGALVYDTFMADLAAIPIREEDSFAVMAEHDDRPAASPTVRRFTYRCTDCGHSFSVHGDAGCEHVNDETTERCTCSQTKEALFASYGPPFPPLTVRGRYLRHLRRYRLRNDPWFIFVRETFAALRAQRQEGQPPPPPWPPLVL